MKKIYLYAGLLCLVVTAISFNACRKVKEGFLSDYLRYSSNPLRVNAGQFYISQGLIPDASTPPFKVTLLDVRNKATGKRQQEFFNLYNVDIWTLPYDPTTDTTLALINKKRTTVKKTPFEIAPVSGQMVFNEASNNIPSGEYLLDLQVENPNGTKVYNNICTIILSPQVEYEYINAPYALAVEANSETAVRFAYDADWINAAVGRSTTAWLRIKRVADSPNQVALKFVDKNGALFAPSEYKQRPNGNSFLKTLSTFAYKTTVTDTAVLYDYATTPFPSLYWDGQSNGINCYYRINASNIASIDTASAAGWNPPNDLPYGTWAKRPVKLNVRFNTRINRPGKYIYEIMLKATKK
ncbi:DUF5007 domain-containing protein [Pedobacter frigidisoli]|uniref:DUF5007 domain-containing protein n=1 Tax=Pedobacter frigidisoli TaxID=2530455 RepID=A0A4V2MMY6_9SPHI|nr:DUF5007 domain-containing protein [Pedobacter frigidisoli]TCD10678.1 DUF5007 domain-containing protein [Pedobacter frigidisoli]